MTRFSQLTHRNFLIATHDALATAFALLASFYLRFEGSEAFFARLPLLLKILPFFVAFSTVICFVFKLTTTKWRFISLPDALNILRVATVLTVALVVLDYAFIFAASSGYPPVFFGRVTIILYWFLQVFALSALRFGYRYFRYSRSAAVPGPKGHRRPCWSVAPPMPKCCCAGSRAAPSSGFGLSACCRHRPRTADSRYATCRCSAGSTMSRMSSAICRARQTDFAARHDAISLRTRGPSRSLSDAREAARPVRQPPAIARERRRAEADQRRGRGPAAAPQREDRLRPPRGAGEGQGCDCDRGRRLDRLGDLRAHRDLRRVAAAGHREFGAGVLCGDGGAGRTRHRRCRSKAALPTSAIANGSCG